MVASGASRPVGNRSRRTVGHFLSCNFEFFDTALEVLEKKVDLVEVSVADAGPGFNCILELVHFVVAVVAEVFELS